MEDQEVEGDEDEEELGDEVVDALLSVISMDLIEGEKDEEG